MTKELWKEYPHIWKTESAFLSWIRGGIRRALWNRHPVKIEFINKNRIKIPNPNPRGRVKEVWGGKCALTGQMHVIADLEVDHIKGGHSLRTSSDIQKFIEGIVLITEVDLQFVSKDAHKAKSLSDKMGITFEEAIAEKLAIQLGKNNTDKDWLIERGIVPASSKAKRREQIVSHMKGSNG